VHVARDPCRPSMECSCPIESDFEGMMLPDPATVTVLKGRRTLRRRPAIGDNSQRALARPASGHCTRRRVIVKSSSLPSAAMVKRSVMIGTSEAIGVNR